MGQALHAASRTVDGAIGPMRSSRAFNPVSLHAYFLRGGSPDIGDILYRVNKTSDLRSFATRTVDAVQRGQVIFTMQVQFGKPNNLGFEHALPMPTDVPPPDECPSQDDALHALRGRVPAAMNTLIDRLLRLPVDIRYTAGLPDLLDPDPEPVWPAQQRLWVRIRDPIGEAERLDECCMTYLSDQPLLVTALLPHRVQFPSPKLGLVTTLDHSMWFFDECRADEWLLYEMTSPRAGQGLGLAFGHLFQRDTGRLVVSCAQQGVARRAKPSLRNTFALALQQASQPSSLLSRLRAVVWG